MASAHVTTTIRLFGDYDLFKQQVKISKYRPDIIADLLLLAMASHANKYVLCPVYGKGTRVTDIQIGITGKTKKGESFPQGLRREVHEESGVLVPLNIGARLGYTVGKTDFRGYIIPFKKCQIATYLPDSKGRDDRNSRVACLIVCDKDDVDELLHIEEFARPWGNDGIIGFGFIPVHKCLDIIFRDY